MAECQGSREEESTRGNLTVLPSRVVGSRSHSFELRSKLRCFILSFLESTHHLVVRLTKVICTFALLSTHHRDEMVVHEEWAFTYCAQRET